MQIKYTRHAKNRMRWRQIPPQMVEMVIRDPDREERLDFTKSHLYKLIGTRNIRITITREDDSIVAISVVDKND